MKLGNNMVKRLVTFSIAAMLMPSNQVASQQLTNNQPNLFHLDEDDLIIQTPQCYDDIESIGSLEDDNNDPQFEIDHTKPIKNHVFFMQDDFFHDIPEIADGEGIQNQTKQEDPEQIEEEQREEEYDEQMKEIEEGEELLRSYHLEEIQGNKRPIYGILSEPIRGDMRKNDTNETQIDAEEEVSYIPKAHVQFLEQSGIRVVPISFFDSEEKIIQILNEINGIYLPGDSQKIITHSKYHQAFSTILKYVNDKYRNEKDYFPLFLMGKSVQVLIAQTALSKMSLHNMRQYGNINTNIKLLKNHDDTFLLSKLADDDSRAHAFDMGFFFNKQSSGLRVKELKSDENLSRLLEPIATFQGSALSDNNMTISNNTKENYHDELEFIAIAEGKELPIYVISYNIEMTQFIYTDLMAREDQQEIIDKTIPARHHSQFLSQAIADEARLNNHTFSVDEEEYTRLVRHHKLVTVEYSQQTSEKKTEYPMPQGLEKHDVYIILKQYIN